MTVRRETEWLLFIDESGAFERERGVWVAGLLLQEPDSPAVGRVLSDMLHQVNPTLPHPLHAAHAQVATFHLAAWQVASKRQKETHFAADEMHRAVREIEAGVVGRAPSLVTARAALGAGRRPDLASLRSLEGRLSKETPAAYRTLAFAANETMRRLRDVLHQIGSRYGLERSAIVGAWDGEEPDASDELATHRYLRLLETLFERVLTLLRARPAQRARVRIRTAVRDIRLDSPSLRLPLRAVDVGGCVRKAERFPLDPPLGPVDPHVRLVADIPSRYDAEAHPGLVLADFIANQLRSPLRRRRSWAQMDREAVATAGITASLTPGCYPATGPGPAIAADGIPRELIDAAFRPRSPSPIEHQTGDIQPGWAREQATWWIAIGSGH